MEPNKPFTNIPNHLRHGDIYDIEKQNLEAHVAICVQRYNALHQHMLKNDTPGAVLKATIDERNSMRDD